MDYFAPGLREVSRRIGRQWLRLRIRMARRQLAKAETTLGLLGWQQADFDEYTQAQVDRIIACEREQAQATNDGAAIGRALCEQTEAREASRQTYEKERALLDQEREKLEKVIATAEEQIGANRESQPTGEARIPELERELRECSRRYSELLGILTPTPAIKQEMLALRERALEIPNEVASLRVAHLKIVAEVHALETQSARTRSQLAAVEKRMQDLEAAFTPEDAGRAEKIHALQRQRTELEEAYASLEGAKENPYREVGRVLADNEIAPMNQPQALDRVRQERFVVEEREAALASSLAVTAAVNPVEIRASLRLWVGIGVGAIIFVIALIVLG